MDNKPKVDALAVADALFNGRPTSANIVLAVETLRAQHSDLEVKDVQLAGAHERAQSLLTAKEQWRQRATEAEAQLSAIGAGGVEPLRKRDAVNDEILLQVGRDIAAMTTCIWATEEFPAIPAIWQSVAEERDRLRAALQAAEAVIAERDRMAAAPAQKHATQLAGQGQEEAQAAKLTKPARVGGGTFGVGVAERYVIDAAQRQYEIQGEREAMTRDQFVEEERKRRALWEMIHGPLPATPIAAAPAQAQEDARDAKGGASC